MSSHRAAAHPRSGQTRTRLALSPIRPDVRSSRSLSAPAGRALVSLQTMISADCRRRQSRQTADNDGLDGLSTDKRREVESRCGLTRVG